MSEAAIRGLYERAAELSSALKAAEKVNAELTTAYTKCRNNASDYATEMTAKLEAAETREKRLREVLERNRQGYRNLLEFRRLSGGRYGALTREELEQTITEIDTALAETRTSK